ncbi:MAG: sigma-70 family RNA polymerase sigma factor [Patescibacteria group bacterium]|jgi:RNA polymerase sigma-70 factor (ECF subfamily)
MPELQFDSHSDASDQGFSTPIEASNRPNDDRLITQAQAGDEQAFGELYDIWAAKVYRFVYVKVKDVAVAEDITSDIFLKAWQKLHQYKRQAGVSFSSWLYAVARNAVIDYYRLTKHSELSFEDLPELADLEGPELYREVSEIETALKNLPEDYEKVLRLRFVEQMPIARVAQVMKKKEDNIRALTSRALKKMRDNLNHES